MVRTAALAHTRALQTIRTVGGTMVCINVARRTVFLIWCLLEDVFFCLDVRLSLCWQVVELVLLYEN